MCYKIVSTRRRLYSGTGVRIKGRYALYHNDEFIAAGDDKADLKKYATHGYITDESDDYLLFNTCVVLAIILLLILAQPVADWMVPYG